jgi:Fe-S-cluster containining protein
MQDREVFPFRFTCRRSGNCCARPGGLVRVGPEDVSRIAAHLGLGEAAFRSRYLAAPGDRLAEGLGGRCVFLSDGRPTACSIYPVRPEHCRSWPFWPELLSSPDELGEATRLCPGIEPREPE